MGCFARIGCLVLLVILACVAYLTRDRWLSHVPGYHPPATATNSPAWQPLTDTGAARASTALQKLAQPKGPVFQTLSGADVASYIFKALARTLPGSADSVEAMVAGDRISVRANVRVADVAGAIGPLAGMLGDREHVQFTGTLRVVKPGVAEFQVLEAKVGQLSVPKAMIPRLIQQVDKSKRGPELSPNGIPLAIPRYVGDIRVSNGKITLYKTVE
jgi:hypothetical protein